LGGFDDRKLYKTIEDSLIKEREALAIGDNVYVKKGSEFVIRVSNQIRSASSVILTGGGGTLAFRRRGDLDRVSLTLKSLIVEGGDGVLYFNTSNNSIFLDDLVIKDGSHLIVRLWSNASDHILVRKTSEHLADTLKKIRFLNRSGQVGVRDYDENYWEIGIGDGFGPLPEPAVYGAAFSLSLLGVLAWRRRVRRARGAVSLSKRH